MSAGDKLDARNEAINKVGDIDSQLVGMIGNAVSNRQVALVRSLLTRRAVWADRVEEFGGQSPELPALLSVEESAVV